MESSSKKTGLIDPQLANINKRFRTIYKSNRNTIESRVESKKLPGITKGAETVFKKLMKNDWSPTRVFYTAYEGSTVVNPMKKIFFSIEYYEYDDDSEEILNQGYIDKSFKKGSTVEDILKWVGQEGGNAFGLIKKIEKDEHTKGYVFLQEDVEYM